MYLHIQMQCTYVCIYIPLYNHIYVDCIHIGDRYIGNIYIYRDIQIDVDRQMDRQDRKLYSWKCIYLSIYFCLFVCSLLLQGVVSCCQNIDKFHEHRKWLEGIKQTNLKGPSVAICTDIIRRILITLNDSSLINGSSRKPFLSSKVCNQRRTF